MAKATTKAETTDVAIFQPARLPYHDAVQERFNVDKGQWKVLVEAIFPAAKSIDSVIMALSYCKTRNLDVFKRPVHIVPMWDSARGGMVESVWPGISELRTTASRTKGYAGCDVAEFGPIIEGSFTGRVKEKGDWKEVTAKVDYPEWCRITVYRIVDGQRCKFVGPKVSWAETYATMGNSDVPNKMWQERPEGQLEKCAEAAALRRAFPEEIGNELTAEEMTGRNVHENEILATVTEITSNVDAGPPRKTIAAPVEPPETVTEEARDGTPPRRTAPVEPPQPDPEPPRRPAPEPLMDSPPEPHQIPGKGHTFESWADQYEDLLKTSANTSAVMAWIDANRDPLDRLGKGKPSIAVRLRQTADRLIQELRERQEKAATKTAAEPAGNMDAPAGNVPMDPETILRKIDEELAAVEDADQLQEVWDTACEPLMGMLEFPPDEDAAQGLYRKHEKRLS
jgi:phage recombination protein Bet